MFFSLTILHRMTAETARGCQQSIFNHDND